MNPPVNSNHIESIQHRNSSLIKTEKLWTFFINHTKKYSQKCSLMLIFQSMVLNVNYKNFKSEYHENSRNFSLGLPRTTIELKNVPAEMNNILVLYQCFSQFGDITLIQVCWNFLKFILHAFLPFERFSFRLCRIVCTVN